MASNEITTVPPQFDIEAIREILTDFEAKGRLQNIDNFTAPFRKLHEWHVEQERIHGVQNAKASTVSGENSQETVGSSGQDVASAGS